MQVPLMSESGQASPAGDVMLPPATPDGARRSAAEIYAQHDPDCTGAVESENVWEMLRAAGHEAGDTSSDRRSH